MARKLGFVVFVCFLMFVCFVLGVSLSGCGAGGSSTSATAPSNPTSPAPSVTVSFTSQPQSVVTVTAGQPATFGPVVAVASNGAAVSYQWTLAGSPVSGATSSTFTVTNTTTQMSGESVTVQADAVGDPAESNPATLLVTPSAPAPGSPNLNPAFVSATPFPLSDMDIYTASNPGDTFPVTIPTVPADGMIAACFVWNSETVAYQTFVNASNAVTDSLGDNFTLLFSFAPAEFSPTTPNDEGGYCYGATSTGGSNIVLTVNVQTFVGTNGAGSIFGGVALVYTGLQGKVDSWSQNNGYLTGNGSVASQQYVDNPVPVNLPNELVLAFGITADSPNGVGNGWNARYVGPACNCSTTSLLVVEDQIGPATVPNTVTPVFYDPVAPPGVFETAAASIY